jgi:predicted GH43/DUF377 family glycosyl hydrolase
MKGNHMIVRRLRLALGMGLLCIVLASCQNGTEDAATEQIGEAQDGFERYTPITSPVFDAPSSDGLVLEPDFMEGQGIAMPGPLLLMEDQYFIFVNIFTEDQGPNAIYTATSEDGLIWQRSEEPIIMDPPGTGSFYLATDVLQDHEGVWHLYLTTNLNGPEYSNDFSIWQATSPALEGPWTVGEEALLETGEPDTWDQGAVLFPMVVETEFGYMMYYHGSNTNDQNFMTSVGVAVSVDGNDWVRGIPGGQDSPYPEFENVVISRLDNDWGDVGLRDVWRTTQGWQMLYFQYFGPQQFPELRLATSPDGIEWEPMDEALSFTMSGMGFFPGVVDASFLPREEGYDLIIGSFLSSSTETFYMTQIRFEHEE